ncbi:MAG: response regulator [Treponema sp.]|nr:MAG: response regulator [Treponema sp.]
MNKDKEPDALADGLEEFDIPNELFIANAVHEIRTPVQTVIGTLDLLSDTRLNKEQIEYVRQIRYGADVLLALVNDILDFSKLKSHKLLIENISYNVKTLTENVAHIIGIEAYNKEIEVVTDIDYSNIPDTVSGDPTRIHQILLNLLKNAVKFTNCGYIHLELTRQNEDLLFQVTDSGIGVSEDKMDSLFKSYYQGDSSFTRKYGGSGLGLAICKLLVKKMNGSIGVKKNPYGGSIFWFTVPLRTEISENSLIPVSYVPPVPATTKILIVDDSNLVRKSLAHQLNSIGLQNIQTSSNGEEAFLKMQYAEQLGNPFDIVFIDMIMPVVEGWHLASKIKNSPLLEKTKLYMLVPEGQMGREAKMKLLDWFAGYLYKPIRREKLDALLIDTNGEIPSAKMLDVIEENKNLDKKNELIKGIKILVAEDHPVNREILVQFLKKFGATIFQAENGMQALNLISKNPEIQIIFMDIQMPVLNGTEATRILRQKKYTGIIIACTANNDSSTFEKYKDIGINDILVKPFKREKVLELLDKWNIIIGLSKATEIFTTEQKKTIANDELWDIQDFEDTIGSDWDLGNQIILDYIDQTGEFLISGKKFIETRNFGELHRVSHTLKGSSAAISANKLANIAAKMNQAAIEKKSDEALLKLLEFEENFNLFLLKTNKWDHKC